MTGRPTFAISNGFLNTRVAVSNYTNDLPCEAVFKDPLNPPYESKYCFQSRACRLQQNPAVIGDAALQTWKQDLDHFGVSWAMKNGTIHNEDTMTSLWLTGIESIQRKMRGLSEKDTLDEETKSDELCLIITEKSLTTKDDREKMTEISFGILPPNGRFYLAIDSLMSLYGSGRTTGLVTETGYEQTQSVPIYEGYAIPHAIELEESSESGMTGQSALKYLSQTVFDQTKDHTFSEKNWECQIPFLESVMKKHVQISSKNREQFETWLQSLESMPIKEASDVERFSDLLYGCTVSDYGRHLPSDLTHLLSQMYGFDLPYSRIILPDSKQSFLLGKEKRSVFEKEGCPHSKSSSEWRSIDELGYFRSMLKVDVDMKPDLWTNIITGGGLASITGYNERLLVWANERKPGYGDSARLISGTRICPAGAEYSAVSGAQILAGLTTFDDMWITREEFIENGPSIVHRKCI